MADVVHFPTEGTFLRNGDEPCGDAEGERFLLEEGLGLLADYRAIADLQVRESLRALVKSLALREREIER